MQVHTFPAFPTEYPPSALLGCVRVTDCLSNEEYVAHYPDGEDNDSAYLFTGSDDTNVRLWRAKANARVMRWP